MATTPQATVAVSANAGALAGGTGYCVVIAPVATNADVTARVYSSRDGLIAQHGYAPGVDYAALHLERTRKPVIFVGLPIVTAGAYGQNDQSGVTGTCAITTSGTPLEEVDGSVLVSTGGTIGVNGIVLSISMDGGRTRKPIKLGAAVTYTVPYFGIILNFAAGTLVAGDEFTFRTTAPKPDSAGVAAARIALAAQQKLSRTWMAVWELETDTEAGYITTAVNAYETSNDRFTLARASVADRLPLAKKSRVVGQTLTFAEVGASGDTITRSAGSWIADGFKVGDNFTIAGSVSNNITTVAGIASLTATVITLATDDLAAEVTTASEDVTITKTQTMAAWVAEADAEFASVTAQKRISLGLGRLRTLSPITGWELRRPVQWAASIREYQHDIHRTTWAKEDGPLLDWSMEDDDNVIVEFNQDLDGGGLEGGFTCARTWGNGPVGPFIAMDLTREVDGSLLSYTHNMQVANVCCTVVQTKTENFVGKTPPLNADGTIQSGPLVVFEESVNSELEQILLRTHVPGEGPRASMAVWRAATDDDLSVVNATMTGAAELRVNGTIVNVSTLVKVS